MVAAKNSKNKPKGRPYKIIDWDLVDELLIAGCPGTEIAPHFDMHPHTFYDRVLEEKNMLFTDYSVQKKCHGDSNIRLCQYRKALGIDDSGDNTMLIWLGKQRLNQRESQEAAVSLETCKQFGAVMEQMRNLRKEQSVKENLCQKDNSEMQ